MNVRIIVFSTIIPPLLVIIYITNKEPATTTSMTMTVIEESRLHDEDDFITIRVSILSILTMIMHHAWLMI
jgi:hypothetical protein